MPENAEQLGQPIVQLRTVSLDIEIEAANVELQSRKMAESELQQSLPAEIESAQAAIDEIKARLQYSKENYERLKSFLLAAVVFPVEKSTRPFRPIARNPS